MLELTGIFWSSLGQWKKSDEKIGSALVTSRRIGDLRRWQECLGQLATQSLHCGRFEQASEQVLQVLPMAQRQGNEQAQAWALCIQSTAKLRLGDVDQALKFAEMAALLPDDKIGTTEAIWIYGELAIARLRKGRVQLAREAAAKASRLIHSTRPVANCNLDGYSAVCETLLALLADALLVK